MWSAREEEPWKESLDHLCVRLEPILLVSQHLLARALRRRRLLRVHIWRRAVRAVEHRDRERLDRDDREHEPEHIAAAVEAEEAVRGARLDRRLDARHRRDADGAPELERAVEQGADRAGLGGRRRAEDRDVVRRVREHRAHGPEAERRERERPVLARRVGEREEDGGDEDEGLPAEDEELGRDPRGEWAGEGDAECEHADGEHVHGGADRGPAVDLLPEDGEDREDGCPPAASPSAAIL
jgi:hypothetical protein